MAQEGKPGKKDNGKRRTAYILYGSLGALLGVVLLLLLSLYLGVYRPKDPHVQVSRVQLLSVSSAPNASFLALSLDLQLSVYNPNRGDFQMEQGSSTACLSFQGSEVGLAPLPTAQISSRSAATVSVAVGMRSPIRLASPASPSPCLPFSVAVAVVGRVTTAHIFSRHSNVSCKCNVRVSFTYPQAYIDSYSCFKT